MKAHLTISKYKVSLGIFLLLPAFAYSDSLPLNLSTHAVYQSPNGMNVTLQRAYYHGYGYGYGWHWHRPSWIHHAYNHAVPYDYDESYGNDEVADEPQYYGYGYNYWHWLPGHWVYRSYFGWRWVPDHWERS